MLFDNFAEMSKVYYLIEDHAESPDCSCFTKPSQQPRHVSFGNVTIFSFKRAIGHSSICGNGGPPIALGSFLAQETRCIDEYEECKQLKGLKRLNKEYRELILLRSGVPSYEIEFVMKESEMLAKNIDYNMKRNKVREIAVRQGRANKAIRVATVAPFKLTFEYLIAMIRSVYGCSMIGVYSVIFLITYC